MEIQKAFEEFNNVAATLIGKTATMHALFLEVERRLGEAKVELECWLTGSCLDESEPVKREDEQHAMTNSGWLLGYAEVYGEWGLAAKQVVFEWDGSDRGELLGLEVYDTDRLVRLSSAPFAVQVEAVEHLEALISSLTKRAKECIRTIESAKGLVANG